MNGARAVLPSARIAPSAKMTSKSGITHHLRLVRAKFQSSARYPRSVVGCSSWSRCDARFASLLSLVIRDTGLL